MRIEEKKEPITVTYVGRGGVFDTPCYMDQNGRYYFDENNGYGTLDLYTGAWKDEECGEICGEPEYQVNCPVICEQPFVRSVYEHEYRMLSRWKMDCEYFLGAGNGYEPHLYFGSVEKICDAMEETWNKLPADEKPEWLTMEQIQEYRKAMLEKRNFRENCVGMDLPKIPDNLPEDSRTAKVNHSRLKLQAYSGKLVAEA